MRKLNKSKVSLGLGHGSSHNLRGGEHWLRDADITFPLPEKQFTAALALNQSTKCSSSEEELSQVSRW